MGPVGTAGPIAVLTTKDVFGLVDPSFSTVTASITHGNGGGNDGIYCVVLPASAFKGGAVQSVQAQALDDGTPVIASAALGPALDFCPSNTSVTVYVYKPRTGEGEKRRFSLVFN